MRFNNIQSFREIILHAKTLLVFDVDDTILHYGPIDRLWWKAISDRHFVEHGDRLKADMLTYISWQDEISRTDPQHTDHDGIRDLLERAKSLNCKIIFLTARKDTTHDITSLHLTQLGIDHQEIYYTNIIGNKGELLNSVIETKYPDFHDYIFVDDVEHNLLAVMQHVEKDIRCFKFNGLHAKEGPTLGSMLANEQGSE
jgi:hypothetical protein